MIRSWTTCGTRRASGASSSGWGSRTDEPSTPTHRPAPQAVQEPPWQWGRSVFSGIARLSGGSSLQPFHMDLQPWLPMSTCISHESRVPPSYERCRARYPPGRQSSPNRPLRVSRHGQGTEVTFGLSPRYGILTARDAHGWFLWMMRFEVETNQVFALERRLLPMEPQCAQREFHDRKPRSGIGASLLQAGYTWSKIQHCHRLAQSRQHCFALSM